MSENGDNQHQDREEETRRSHDDEYDRDQNNEDHREQRQYDDDDVSRDQNNQQKEDQHNNQEPEQNFSLHVTGDEIGFKINEDSIKAYFEKFGEVSKVSIIRDPATHASRRFCFVGMARVEDALRAITEMEAGGQIDGFDVKCQRAKRKQPYEKTPGQYLGPPGLSSKFIRDRRDRERGGGGGDRRRDRNSRDRGGYERRDRSRERVRERSRDRYPPRDYDRGYDRGFDPRDARPPMRDPRGFDPRDMRDPRGFDPRDFRGPPPRYDMDPRGPPPPHFMDHRGPPSGGYDMRARSPPRFHRERSPPPVGRMDDHRPIAPTLFEGGGRVPPVANYAASSYYANAGNTGGGRGGSQQLPHRY